MKMPVRIAKKIILGIILISFAAGISVFLKESLDTLDPESSLPILTVTQNGQPVTDVYRAGYQWSFFATVERRTPQVSEADLPLVPVPVAPLADIRLDFSAKPSTLKVYRASHRPSAEYLEIASENPAAFPAPGTAGTYIYKIFAEWGDRGHIQYYFSVYVTG